jgi:hypothetical protein
MAALQSQLKLTRFEGITAKMRGITAGIDNLQASDRRVMAPFTGMMGKVVAFGGAYLGVSLGGRGFFKKDYSLFGTSFKRAVVLSAMLELFCYLMKHYLIYLFDPDWLLLRSRPSTKMSRG